MQCIGRQTPQWIFRLLNFRVLYFKRFYFRRFNIHCFLAPQQPITSISYWLSSSDKSISVVSNSMSQNSRQELWHRHALQTYLAQSWQEHALIILATSPISSSQRFAIRITRIRYNYSKSSQVLSRISKIASVWEIRWHLVGKWSVEAPKPAIFRWIVLVLLRFSPVEAKCGIFSVQIAIA